MASLGGGLATRVPTSSNFNFTNRDSTMRSSFASRRPKARKIEADEEEAEEAEESSLSKSSA